MEEHAEDHSEDRPLTVLLIHGGLGEDIGADRFWVRPGIVDVLESVGTNVIAPDRNTTPSTVAHLLAGDTVRGVSDDELQSIRVPVAVMATDPENQVHQYRTVLRSHVR